MAGYGFASNPPYELRAGGGAGEDAERGRQQKPGAQRPESEIAANAHAPLLWPAKFVALRPQHLVFSTHGSGEKPRRNAAVMEPSYNTTFASERNLSMGRPARSRDALASPRLLIRHGRACPGRRFGSTASSAAGSTSRAGRILAISALVSWRTSPSAPVSGLLVSGFFGMITNLASAGLLEN